MIWRLGYSRDILWAPIPSHSQVKTPPVPYELLLNIWQVAARHAPIADTAARIAELAAPYTDADSMVVRRVDALLTRSEPAAHRPLRAASLPPASPMVLSPAEHRALLEWCRRREVSLFRRTGDDGIAPVVVGAGGFEEVLAAPLVADGDVVGTLALVESRTGQFTDAHVALLTGLAAPLAVALVNDARLHEFTRLREALEADRRALLQRLDRIDVSDAIVGADSGLRRVMERVEQVAPTDVPILLLGETGSGKEVVARAIHARSRRRQGPIVRVNCGALPAGLIDSELFGHERGSFTGAVSARKGWFERADGGTLFLDEVAELPLDAQVRLLRILQDGTFERVGGQQTQSVDVRIVAATHRNLRDMVARGTFREDLWYRIGVFPIEIPALRERPEDIPMLATHFAARAGMRLGGAPLALDAEAIEQLVMYPWPGNVRELGAVIERAAILGDGHRLHVAAALGHPVPAEPARYAGEEKQESEPLESLDRAMQRHIERALRATKGQIEGKNGAAALLGLNPPHAASADAETPHRLGTLPGRPVRGRSIGSGARDSVPEMESRAWQRANSFTADLRR
jgi:hydrogenase-4 transcriptional activator